MNTWTGLDIGGANIKGAVVDRSDDSPQIRNAFSHEFPLWRRQCELLSVLRQIASDTPHDSSVAVTMTGELADCFADKAEGVRFIAEQVASAFFGRDIFFYQSSGAFVSKVQACAIPLETAAANWHALTAYSARYMQVDDEHETNQSATGMMIDIGSTTTDIIPVLDGRAASNGKNDTTRMIHGELVYTGVVRSPVCSLTDSALVAGREVPVAQELFATILDAHIIAGNVSPDPQDCRTADSRPATMDASLHRMARMLCADRNELEVSVLIELANRVCSNQRALIARAIQTVWSENNLPANGNVILSGTGSWLAREILTDLRPHARVRSLDSVLSPQACAAAPAVAVATLALENISLVSATVADKQS